MRKAHTTHPELKVTLHLDIIGVKKNPNGQSYTQLGVLTKGTIIEVNVSELGLVTPGGKVVWGKYAQVVPIGHPASALSGFMCWSSQLFSEFKFSTIEYGSIR